MVDFKLPAIDPKTADEEEAFADLKTYWHLKHSKYIQLDGL